MAWMGARRAPRLGARPELVVVIDSTHTDLPALPALAA